MMEAPLQQDRFEAMEAYVLGRMDGVQRGRFEAELAADEALRAELALHREHIMAVELAGVERQLSQLAAVLDDDGAGVSPFPSGHWLKYAAMVAVLVLGALWWANRPATNERLFAEHHAPDPGLPVPMSAVDNPHFHDAMVAYKLGDYNEAYGKWSSLLAHDPGNDTLIYFMASARLAAGDAGAAIPLFQRVAGQPGSAFHKKARWYLFLSCLREGRYEELHALGLEQDSTYGDRVRRIENELDR